MNEPEKDTEALANLNEKSVAKAASTEHQTINLGIIGALRDDADLLDKAVEHAMRVREERPWRFWDDQ